MEDEWNVDKITWKFLLKNIFCWLNENMLMGQLYSREMQWQNKQSTEGVLSHGCVMYFITSCEEPKEAWDTLKKHFKGETLANKLFLKK